METSKRNVPNKREEKIEGKESERQVSWAIHHFMHFKSSQTTL